MEDHNDIEDVAPFTTEDTAEAQSRRWDEMVADLRKEVEAMPELPTAEEAELGELCRMPKGQFDSCELVDEGTATLIESLEG
jgi:hypothetical protein